VVAAVAERVNQAGQALAMLQEAITGDDGSIIRRDATLLRFAYTAETLWKAQRAVLLAADGVETGSPKGTVREARACGYLSDEDARVATEALDARNLVVHTYKEQLARDLHQRIKAFMPVLERWYAALAASLPR
jgi:nucleotidyltransferase substrate binding protein (TIGR01987 family)